MPDRPLIRLAITHDYDDPAEPAVGVAVPPQVVLRRQGRQHAVILPDWEEEPARLSLDLFWSDLNFCSVTKGYDWSAVPVLVADAGRDRVVFGQDQVLRTEPRRPRDRRIMQLEVEIAPGECRDIQLAFESVAAHWHYHLTGRGLRDDLQIVDPGQTISFDDLGSETLPNGMTARSLRSWVPLPLRARASQRFSLQYEGRFGAVVLVPALPAAGTTLRPLAQNPNEAGLQADIYVTLN